VRRDSAHGGHCRVARHSPSVNSHEQARKIELRIEWQPSKEELPMQRTAATVLALTLGVCCGAMLAGRRGILAGADPQKKNPAQCEEWSRGIPGGKTLVVDMTHAINDKEPAWPGDENKPFEATILATPEKDGYLTRRFS